EHSPIRTLISSGWQPKKRILPHLSKAEKRKKGRRRHADVMGPDTFSNNWAGCVVTANERTPKPKSPVDGHSSSFSSQQQAYFIGDDDHVYELSSKDFWKLSDLTAFTMPMGAPIASKKSALCAYATTHDRKQHAIYISEDGHVNELVF